MGNIIIKIIEWLEREGCSNKNEYGQGGHIIECSRGVTSVATAGGYNNEMGVYINNEYGQGGSPASVATAGGKYAVAAAAAAART